MFRSASHSSYPLDGADPGDEATAGIVAAEQSRAFVDVVSDGQVGWAGPLSHVAARLHGVDLSGEAAWPDPRVRERRPVLRGEVRRRGEIALSAWRAASTVTPKPVKVTLPGPLTRLQVVVIVAPGGRPSSMALPLSNALAGKVID